MKNNILFNSVNRAYGTSSSFQIQYSLRQFYKCNSFYISSVTIPSSYYVINTINNFGFIIYGGGEYQITITPGNYTPSELVSTIQTQLTAISTDLSISYNTNTGLFSFSTSSAAFGLDATEINNLLSTLMGFLQQVYPSDTTTKTSTYVANLSGPKYVQIVSNTLSYKSSFEPSSTNTNIKNVILRIPVKVNSFDMIVYENYNESNVIPFDKEFPNVIDISLIDEKGDAINLNGCEWSFNLVAFFTEIYSAKF